MFDMISEGINEKCQFKNKKMKSSQNMSAHFLLLTESFLYLQIIHSILTFQFRIGITGLLSLLSFTKRS